MNIKNLNLLLLLSAFFLFSCSDEDVTPEMEFEYPAEPVPEPTEDVVKTSFNKKVTILADSDANPVLTYILKRMGNTTSVLDESAEVVLMGDSKVAEVLDDAASLSVLKTLWHHNKAIVFAYPGKNALELYCKLTDRNVESVSQEIIDRYKNLSLLVVRADGKQFMHEDFRTSYVSTRYIEYVDEENPSGPVMNDSIKVTKEITPSDYNWGQMAENLCEWFKDNDASMEGRSASFVAKSRANSTIAYTETTIRPAIYVDYDIPSDWGTPPRASKTVSPYIKVRVAGGYNEQYNSDVYDVTISEIFPADETAVVNEVIKKGKLSVYKNKYTGGYYLGPHVTAQLYSTNQSIKFDESSVELLDPVPMQSGTSYQVTHDPGGWSIGANVNASLSGGGPELSAGFSATYSFPSETKTEVVSDMPVVFSQNDVTAIWKYGPSYFMPYETQFGLNADFTHLPDIYQQRCETKQAIAFRVQDSKDFGDENIFLNLSVLFELREVMASPKETGFGTNTYTTVPLDVLMPKVPRYNKDFSPFCYHTDASLDTEAWSSLEAVLDDNLNYRTFQEEGLSVGATSEEDVLKTAREIWESTIDALIHTNNKNKTSHNYIIGLADENGNCLDLGLSVDTLGNWVKVDNLKK